MEAILGSEAILALYPILIKRVNTNLVTQLLSRLGTFTIISALLAKPDDWATTWGSPAAATESIILGIMNLIHIASSYISYYHLPAGTALSIFYLYPLFNVIAGALFFGDTIGIITVPVFALAFYGVYLFSQERQKEEEEFLDAGTNIIKKPVIGIVAALISALTETLIYVAIKSAPRPNVFMHHLHLYAGGFLTLLLAVLAGKTEAVDLKLSSWTPLLLFNVLIGYIGYSLRFYIIPKTKTGLFSILSFVGVIAAFFWGYLLAGETPGPKTVAGSAAILASIAGYFATGMK